MYFRYLIAVIFIDCYFSHVAFQSICMGVTLSVHFSLVNLTSLELRENLLKGLPESVSYLTKLERLDIGDNDIEELVSLCVL